MSRAGQVRYLFCPCTDQVGSCFKCPLGIIRDDFMGIYLFRYTVKKYNRQASLMQIFQMADIAGFGYKEMSRPSTDLDARCCTFFFSRS